jgi:hypothetical protein
MRRAVLLLLLLAALPFPSTALAATQSGPVDAIGLLNYKIGPRFKVGDWVRYTVRGTSAKGQKTDYTITLLIAGEERWWGEDCFWVETQISYFGEAPMLAASLLSYAVFQDSLPTIRFARYIRKYIDMLDVSGVPAQQLYRRAPAELTTRGFGEYQPVLQKDTVGVEKVTVPKGTFEALRVNRHHRSFITEHKADSSVYYEATRDHAYYTSDEVPITGLVRIDQTDTQRSRSWVAGESENAPLRVLEVATGSTELIDYGSGMTAQLVPEHLRHPLSEKRDVPLKRPPPPAPRKAASTRG